ncbi:MAG: hypothetical protein HYT80_07595 [Euryarchaeota archaeon]|nr:hypothetical protein [Euryarchaeota archaeon]
MQQIGAAVLAVGLVVFAFLPEAEARDGNGNNAPACNDGADNDGDGYTDYPADPGCSAKGDKDEYNAAAASACGDGTDNDGDGAIDYPTDPGCSSSQDDDESNEPPRAACEDGMDNDQDGQTDYPSDPGCSSTQDNDETDTQSPPAQCGLGPEDEPRLWLNGVCVPSVGPVLVIGQVEAEFHCAGIDARPDVWGWFEVWKDENGNGKVDRDSDTLLQRWEEPEDTWWCSY